MKSFICNWLALLMLCLVPAAGLAQEPAERHPRLDADWSLSLGAFFPDSDFELSASGNLPGVDLDFDQSAGVDDSETTPIFSLRWRFGEKWSVWTQAWQTDNRGQASLTEDVVWNDLIFQAGTNVEGGIETSVVRLFFGRNFSTGTKHEFGAGLGLHWLEIEAYLQGDVLTNEGNLNFARSSVDAALPLPNVGAWYHYAFSDRWMFEARGDWLGASVGDYSGTLWNASAGIQWQMTDHFGLALNYQLFILDGDIDKSDWRGNAELTNAGALLSLTANW